ncbi:hypothetical protein H310_11580 [Aphanomyces invadans]|uniref:Nucleotide-diphospho-sugar transferase domain-containing protein n=1 Tax=Aphanomyces invadans TaxID=157072 RepID=A0A024TLU1_9STRA|nr:hypothetical protein H310_11580 [Aphanomyces invadans]ETV94934.1 hypothetical protein H310_11580 [Aphanomyces invadans]|eukprot:XP_008876525.1 hypothetical protein H310_11580 [Aphanomyces invadans]
MLYATTELTMCNALIMARNIRRLGTPPSIPIVILISAALETQQHAWTATVEATHTKMTFVEPWISQSMRGESSIWRESLTKLRIFEERGYDRVVYLDSDMWLHRNLDHLFALTSSDDSASVDETLHKAPYDDRLAQLRPLHVQGEGGRGASDSMLWAPRAYYISPQPFFASTLLVFTPSNARFRQLSQAVAASTRPDYYDMDVLNDVWHPVTFLPPHYVVLNADLLAPDSNLLGFANASDRIANTYAHHYSSLPNGKYGKPWEVERPPNNKWRTKRKSSPLMYELFDLYLDAKDRECPWLRRQDTAKSLPSTHGYLWQLIFGSNARR